VTPAGARRRISKGSRFVFFAVFVSFAPFVRFVPKDRDRACSVISLNSVIQTNQA